jgi:pimeloyl-ACP methyl ester carboxylesterase
MHFATFEGRKIAYRKDGTGPALLLVHGTGGDGGSNWEEVTQELAKDYTVVRPDYAGSGATEDDGRVLTVDYLAAQIMAVATHAGLTQFALAGFSLGAAVAVHVAAHWPERISNLILLAGFASADPRLKIEMELWRTLIATNPRAMAQVILLTGFSPDTLSSWGSDGVAQALQDLDTTMDWKGMARQVELDLVLDVSAALGKISAPALVIGATHDHMVPPAHSRALAVAIDGATYAELPTGHLAPMERPDLTAAQIRGFLQRS